MTVGGFPQTPSGRLAPSGCGSAAAAARPCRCTPADETAFPMTAPTVPDNWTVGAKNQGYCACRPRLWDGRSTDISLEAERNWEKAEEAGKNRGSHGKLQEAATSRGQPRVAAGARAIRRERISGARRGQRWEEEEQLDAGHPTEPTTKDQDGVCLTTVGRGRRTWPNRRSQPSSHRAGTAPHFPDVSPDTCGCRGKNTETSTLPLQLPRPGGAEMTKKEDDRQVFWTH